MEPLFFSNQAELREWFKANHNKLTEQWIGYYKKPSGIPGITWPESVDEALCFGWIDGIRKSIDGLSYMIRFTPRNAKSTWSTKNINRVKELTAMGLMYPAGIEAFNKREDSRSSIYSFEQEQVSLSSDLEKIFVLNSKAWSFFQSQPISYRKPAIWWVMSAKQEATQMKRLLTLINDSESGQRISLLRRSKT